MYQLKKMIGVPITGMLLMLLGAASAQAALVEATMIGDVITGDEFSPNNYGLSGGDIITATAIFDDSALTGAGGTVSFGGGNSLSIDVNGTIFTDADDTGASLTFDSYTSGASATLLDFDYSAMVGGDSFNSLGAYFDDQDNMYGQWRTDVGVAVVPVPAAAWLFGSGVIALGGMVRRRKA